MWNATMNQLFLPSANMVFDGGSSLQALSLYLSHCTTNTILIMLLIAACAAAILACFIVILYLLNIIYRKELIGDFREKTVFITGCDSGFGRLLALKLDSLGLKVFAGCLTEAGARTLEKTASDELKTVILDITDEESVLKAKKFVENDLQNGQTLWGLVNNAGILGNICFDLLGVDDYRNVLEVNLFGTIKMINAFSPLIKKSKGRVVTVTSILRRVSCGACPYTASKASLSIFCDELRRNLRKFGVKCSTIEPGYHRRTGLVIDDIWSSGVRKQWESLSEDTKNELGGEKFLKNELNSNRLLFERVPFHQWNSEAEVVNAMVNALGSKRPKSRYVCGWDAKCIALFVSFIPDWLLDFGLRNIVKQNWYNILLDG